MGQPFPLPAADSGPAPCYCLIGRVGDGPPFYVGPWRSWSSDRSGTLQLGINDYNVTDNVGSFTVTITLGGAVEPVWERAEVSEPFGAAGPLAGCSVVVFYVDGLRPDVVVEMAAMGHLPTIRRYFLDGGTWLSRSVTVFPSNTITTNGTLWTGRYPDRHGLKSQTRFSRRGLQAVPHLDPLGPSRTAAVLRPHGLGRVGFKLRYLFRGLTRGRAAARQWAQSQTSNTPAIYDYVRRAGGQWTPGALPISPETPPGIWSRHLTNALPLFGMHQAIFRLDEADAGFALDHQLALDRPVTIIWLPDVDTHSHHRPRGQFGQSRRTIARCDRLIGLCIEKLRRLGRLERTYLMLVSDHGHVGGRQQRLKRYDLAHEFFYESRHIDGQGRWVGGGLGLSVRQDRDHHRHRGENRRRFVFLESEGSGAARIFLPYGCYHCGPWMPPNTFASLVRYRVACNREPVNLLARLTNANAGTPQTPEFPIDLVLCKLDDQSVVVATRDRGWAVIERRPIEGHGYVYRYQVMQRYWIEPDGRVRWQPAARPQQDPLGLLNVVSPAFLAEFHDEQTWLQVTVRTRYPDSVVALSRHLLWDPALRAREREYGPDLVVTAAAGWKFGSCEEPGTAHGYLLRAAMLNTWFVAGPNVRRGAVVKQPCRAVDLLPTVLEMAGVSFCMSEFDGRPLRTIYQPGGRMSEPACGTDEAGPARLAVAPNSIVPVYWRDCDLDGWQALPPAARPEYHLRWAPVHRYDARWDLHNVFNNVASISDLELVRLGDGLLHRTSGRRPLAARLQRRSARLDRMRASGSCHRALADAVNSLQLRHLALGDWSYTSGGHWYRANLVVDWFQDRLAGLDRRLACPLGVRSVVGAPLLNRGVDHVQGAANEVRRSLCRGMFWLVGEKIINPLESGIAAVRNRHKDTPAEVCVR